MPSLQELLSRVIDKDISIEVLHLRRPSEECCPLVSQKVTNATQSMHTIKSQHFIVLSQNKQVFYGIEVYVYFTIDQLSKTGERLYFISKADSNGYCEANISIKAVTEMILDYLLGIDPASYLAKIKPKCRNLKRFKNVISRATNQKRALLILSKRLKDSHRNIPVMNERDLYVSFDCERINWVTKICLFTRAEPQYLFAESSKNPNKHILNGQQLLKWWLCIIDNVTCKNFTDGTQARIRIPGEEPSFIMKYISATRFPNWQVGDIFEGSPKDLAILRIPMFPDDPKGRFLDHLLEDGRIKAVQIDAFWTELQAQQEFRLGATVSVIGVAGQVLTRSIEAFDKDVITTSSKKQFNFLKSYVTGEEYDSREGALDAYMNLRDYLSLKMNREMLRVGGVKAVPKANQIRYHRGVTKVNDLNTMIVRKKRK
ncbi:LAFE_0A06040g1_1 [Lachancea fermentati]|uniref:histone acetyltransferase n=1 Tax=Lachancea fermentati TaxID=4955 RepID=A0A1G4M6V5_LACFM|nr:LAFE_0A06040g1_1 [Lachancea fermentati]